MTKKYMKRYLTSFVNQEIQSKTTMRQYFTFIRKTKIKIERERNKSVGENVEKLEPSNTVGGNINGTAAVENNLTVSQNAKHRLTI